MSDENGSNDNGPVVLITGVSSGFGRVTADLLSQRGLRVFGTTRRPTSESVPYEPIRMNVDDEDSVRAGVESVIAAAGRIDVVLNNAGISIVGSVEDTTIEEAKQQLDTNLFGVIRVIQAVLPHMRAQKAGKIINVSSIGGLIGLPFQSFYSMSKFGVEALTEALRMELRPFGIEVCCIEPGDFKTAMTDKRILAEAAESEVYGEQMRRTVDAYSQDERNGSDPALFARLVLKLIESRHVRPRYMVGAAGQKAGALLKRVMGASLFERFILQHCRIE
jgi:NAD(P)-dependent dehydrogenase (short-subunit alcohol dehydrogenase family)